MSNTQYGLLLLLILGGLLGAMYKMSEALDDFDIAGFSLWTCVASVIAGVPLMLVG